jgi:hypothetical protein
MNIIIISGCAHHEKVIIRLVNIIKQKLCSVRLRTLGCYAETVGNDICSK